MKFLYGAEVPVQRALIINGILSRGQLSVKAWRYNQLIVNPNNLTFVTRKQICPDRNFSIDVGFN